MLSRLLMTTIALAAYARAAPGRPFVDCSRAELIKAAPELSAIEFDSDQSALDPLLSATGQQLESMLAKFINVSIAEDVHEMRLYGKCADLYDRLARSLRTSWIRRVTGRPYQKWTAR
jgi:hypothetical protein